MPIIAHVFSVGLLMALCALSEPALAQFRSATVFGNYSSALTKRLGVTEARGWGGGLELRYDITPQFGISLTGSYEYLAIKQADALDQWNWDFWIQRYRGIVQANLASDPNLSATLTPEVAMESLPVYLAGWFEVEPLGGLTLRPYAGAGIYFYTKNLYLHEQWSKYFPDVDYTLTYDYRNFAPSKEGNPFLGVVGIDVTYRLVDLIECTGGVRYLQILGSEGSRGYDEVPMENSLSVRLGIGFVY